MSDAQQLIDALHALGATLRTDGTDLKIRPAGIVTPELRDRLREHKAELLRLLEPEAELRESAERLEAARISIAVWPDGSMLVVTGNAVGQAWRDGGLVFAPSEMLLYVSLSEPERLIMRGLKGLKP